MRELEARIAQDADLATQYEQAHRDYIAQREAIEDVPELRGISAGGMPTRVKCLHVLVAHSLAAGPGVNPIGDVALELLDDWWVAGPCAQAES